MSRTLGSLDDQIYPYWSVIIEPTASLAAPSEDTDHDFIVPLRIGDTFSEAGLFRLAEALQTQRALILYGDEDVSDEAGQRTRPWFKPRWNRELFLSKDYLHGAMAISAKLFGLNRDNRTLGVPELVLRAVAQVDDDQIVHVPHVLCHRGIWSERGFDERQAPLAQHLAQKSAITSLAPFQTNRTIWPLPAQLPLVSVIIPTKDRLDLLRPCVETVLNRTEYANVELIVVDNLSTEMATADYLAEIANEPSVRVLNYAKPYNFSAINNFAASCASGSYLCLLNNDTEVIEPGWLTEMMRYAVRPEIGAVGAKLLYEDGSIQHAGVVVGMGGAAGHAHRYEPNDAAGYFAMPHVAHYVSAVTAACLVVAKNKFLAVGGLDEEAFVVAFNDVDFCLKLQAEGWKNVYVPHAVLIHHESKSRGDDMAPSQIERYRGELRTLQERWGTVDYADPLHSPNLDPSCEQYVIRL